MGSDLALRSAGECGPILESYLTVELHITKWCLVPKILFSFQVLCQEKGYDN